MTSSSVTAADSESAKSTPASSPPPLDERQDGISKEMHKEEDRIRLQREKDDKKNALKLEKERLDDLQSGKDLLDKKFQQLEFLMNKSKVSCSPVRAPNLIN
jgi:ATP-dependent DNA helicase